MLLENQFFVPFLDFVTFFSFFQKRPHLATKYSFEPYFVLLFCKTLYPLLDSSELREDATCHNVTCGPCCFLLTPKNDLKPNQRDERWGNEPLRQRRHALRVTRGLCPPGSCSICAALAAGSSRLNRLQDVAINKAPR